MQSDKFTAWLAEKAVGDLREGRNLSPEVVAELHKAEVVGAMRDRVEEDDVPPLLRIAQESPHTDVRILTVSILANHENAREVQTALLDQWSLLTSQAGVTEGSEEEDHYRERHNLMWRIGGFRPEKLQEYGLYERWTQFSAEAFALVKSDFARFFRVQDSFTGGQFAGDRSQFQPFVEKRLSEIEGGRFPRAKTWLYLCVAAGADDRDWARRLLREYAANKEDDMDFVRDVAKALLSQAEAA